MRTSGTRGFTLMETVIAILVVGVLIAVAILMLPRGRSRGSLPAPQVRGIQQACALWAQGNGNFYPGLDRNGRIVDDRVENRYRIMLEGCYFTGEWIIAPEEVKQAWTTGQVTTANYSYCLLQLNTDGAPTVEGPATGRYAEWANTINTLGAAVSDRSLAQGAAATGLKTTSLHVKTTTAAPGDWHGWVGWGDNHVSMEKSAILTTTKYGAVTNQNDDLFSATGTSDAWMIYSGNGR